MARNRKRRQKGLAGRGPIVTFSKEGELLIDQELLAEYGFDVEYYTKLIHDCAYSPEACEKFCKYFLRESFRKNKNVSPSFSREQSEYARMLSDPKNPMVWQMAYRKFGKTTIAWGELLRRILFRQMYFLLYVTSDQPLAERRTENIRKALNFPRIRLFFGNFKPEFEDGEREVFGTKAWKLTDPVSNEITFMCCPKGDDTTVNGLVEYIAGQMRRPDVIVVDDVTDRKRVDDEVYRSKQNDWCFGTLFECVDSDFQPDPITHLWPDLWMGDIPPWQILVIDTCKHSGCFIEMCSTHPDFVGKRHPRAKEVKPGKFVSLVEGLSDAQINALFARYCAAGHEDRFWKEHMCRPRASSECVFPETYEYYNDAECKERLNNDHDAIKFLIMDPARTQNPKSSFTAILSVAVNPYKSTLWLRGMIHAKLTDIEIEKSFLDLAVDHNCIVLGVEDNGLGIWINGPLQRAAAARGIYSEFKWIPTHRKHIEADGEYRNIKQIRASSALWFYRERKDSPGWRVFHDISLKGGALEEQMKSFPECKNGWDAIDTLGHVDWMLRELQIYPYVIPERKSKRDGKIRNDHDELGEIIKSGEWRASSCL